MRMSKVRNVRALNFSLGVDIDNLVFADLHVVFFLRMVKLQW